MRMFRLALLLVLLPAHAFTQDTPGVLESYQRARQLVDRAVTAHGGVEALRGARQLRVRTAGEDVWRHQSRGAEPPYDRLPHTADLVIDLERGRLIVDVTRTYPGGIHRAFRFVTDGDKSYYVNHRDRTYTPSDYPKAETQIGNLYDLPQFVLLDALESGQRLRSLGRMRLASGVIVDAVVAATPNGQLTIGFHPESGRVHCTLGLANDRVAGPSAGETEFLGYRELNGVLLPTRRVVSVGGEVTSDRVYVDATPNYRSPDVLANPPAGYQELRESEVLPVRELAHEVWLVGGGSSALVVGFADHVLVIDAPPSTAADTLKRVATLAPGKPIRYVIPTHHHDDHSAGARTYAAAAATVVTTPGSKALLEKIAGTRVEVIAGGRREFSDGTRRVEIHDIGGTAHANEMLVAWLPAEGIVFGGDLIDVPAGGAIGPGSNNPITRYFDRWVRDRGWRIRTYADAHGAVLDAAAFRDLVSRPLLPR